MKEDEPLHVEKSDWEKLSELNDTSYLRKVVMPIIYPVSYWKTKAVYSFS